MITNERQATSEEWDEIWNHCEYATYFHSREWAEIWQNYSNEKMIPHARIITFSDGKSALLTLSVQWILRGVFKKHLSSPAGTYGGWLSLDVLSEDHSRILHTYITTHCKNLVWRLNPFGPVDTSPPTKEIKHDETLALNLEPGFEAIFKTWSKGHASAARKARKAGVEIREATTLQEWKDYYSLYEDSLKRWGEAATSHYNWRLFQHIYDLSSPDIKLWIATYKNQIVAGALCLYANKHVAYWHGSASSDHFQLRPVNLLMYEVIEKSCASGFKWFDFNPSGGHEGVKAFKKSFGTEAIASPVVSSTSEAVKLYLMLLGKANGALRKIKNKLS